MYISISIYRCHQGEIRRMKIKHTCIYVCVYVYMYIHTHIHYIATGCISSHIHNQTSCTHAHTETTTIQRIAKTFHHRKTIASSATATATPSTEYLSLKSPKQKRIKRNHPNRSNLAGVPWCRSKSYLVSAVMRSTPRFNIAPIRRATSSPTAPSRRKRPTCVPNSGAKRTARLI